MKDEVSQHPRRQITTIDRAYVTTFPAKLST